MTEEQEVRPVGYVRASTEKQNLTIAAQTARLIDYASARGWEYTAICTDVGVSASIPLADREEGGRMLDILDSGRANTVIFPAVDRAFRSTRDCCDCIEEWNNKKIAVHIINLGIDPTTPMGVMILTMLASFAQFEREMTKERITDVLANKREQGLRWCGTAPYGFMWVKSTRGDIIKPCMGEMEVIDLICDLYRDGNTPYRISKILTETKVENRSGHCEWFHSTIIKILKDKGLRIPVPRKKEIA